MNEDSCGPRRSRETPDPSSLAYCRRLPYRSCRAFITGVNTNDPKLCAIATPLKQRVDLRSNSPLLQMGSAYHRLFPEKRFDPAGDLFPVRLKFMRLPQRSAAVTSSAGALLRCSGSLGCT